MQNINTISVELADGISELRKKTSNGVLPYTVCLSDEELKDLEYQLPSSDASIPMVDALKLGISEESDVVYLPTMIDGYYAVSSLFVEEGLKDGAEVVLQLPGDMESASAPISSISNESDVPTYVLSTGTRIQPELLLFDTIMEHMSNANPELAEEK